MDILLVNGSTLPKQPSELSFDMYDISDEDAGRVADTSRTMYKNRIGEIHVINVAWINLTPAEEAAILQLFASEYISVTYYDPYAAGATVTRTFYRGDINTVVRQFASTKKRYSKLSFKLEERAVHTN